MGSCLEARTLDGVIVEPIPLLELVPGIFCVFVAPHEHLGLELNASAVAVGSDGALWVVEHVVGVKNRDLPLVDDALLNEEVEEAYELLVSSLVGHEVVEAGNLVQRRDGTAVVGGNGAARMADQKGKVELPEDVERENSRILWLVGAAERWRNLCRLAIGAEEIVGHIFYEDTLAL